MNSGKVLLLQGPSSAGKSTLARHLQTALDEYWWVLEADDITRMQPIWRNAGAFWEPASDERPHPSWNPDVRLARWLAGYWQCIASIAKTGSNVIAVGGWLETAWLLDLAAVLDGIDAYCVGIYCSLDELERRERERGDRAVGYARSHYDRVHTHAPYDAQIDTSISSTDGAAVVIQSMLTDAHMPTFFERIRAAQNHNDPQKTNTVRRAAQRRRQHG